MNLAGFHICSTDGSFTDREINTVHSRLFQSLPLFAPVCPQTRILRYETVSPSGSHTLFAAVELPVGAEVPDGMTEWLLDADMLTIRCAGESGDMQEERLSIRPQWTRHVGAFGSGCTLVEFEAEPDSGIRCRYELTAHACIRPGEPYEENDGIRLAPPDPAWPRTFESYAESLRKSAAGGLFGRIEHHGSTAVPGLAAKPIIDILAEIPAGDAARRELIADLVSESCEYWRTGSRLLFIGRRRCMGRRVLHLHCAVTGDPVWEQLSFRDHLRNNPDDALLYENVKRALAEQYRNDREGYTAAKSAIIADISSRFAGRESGRVDQDRRAL